VLFHSGDLPVGGGVGGKGGRVVVALQRFRRVEIESSLGWVPLTRRCHGQRLWPPLHWWWLPARGAAPAALLPCPGACGGAVLTLN